MKFKEFLDSIQNTWPALPQDTQTNKKYIKGGIPEPINIPSSQPNKPFNQTNSYDNPYTQNLLQSPQTLLTFLIYCNQLCQNYKPNKFSKKIIAILKSYQKTNNLKDWNAYDDEPPYGNFGTPNWTAWFITYASYNLIINPHENDLLDLITMTSIYTNIPEFNILQYIPLLFAKITKPLILKSDKKELKRLANLKSLSPNDVNHILILLLDKEYIHDLLTYISKLTNTNINDTVQLLKNDNTYHLLLQHYIKSLL